MITIPSINQLKTAVIIIAVIGLVWLYKDYQFQKIENKRQTENSNQLRKADSLKYTTQVLTSAEIQDYLTYDNKSLQQKLANDRIKLSRIESIVSQTLKYKDDTLRQTDLTNIVKSIKNNIPTSTEIKDSTKCLTIKGFIQFKNDSLKLKITQRKFNNKTDAVAYWQRRQWKFLGIKTRLLGKKEFTAVNYSDCGESTVMKIEKKK